MTVTVTWQPANTWVITIVAGILTSTTCWKHVLLIADDSNVKFPKRPVTSEERLIHDLFVDYDTDARPVVNTTTSVLVTVQFLLLHIHRLVNVTSSYSHCSILSKILLPSSMAVTIYILCFIHELELLLSCCYNFLWFTVHQPSWRNSR